MEWVTIAIGIVEGITAILLAIVAASKKLRKAIGAPITNWIKGVVKEATQEEFDKIHSFIDKTEKHEITVLRHEITLIYEKYRKEKKIPVRVKQSLCSLYEQYSELGGNSYVQSIMEEMVDDWEEI